MTELEMGFPKQGPVIAIDGPAGTGKSSATKRLATALGFVHVDTGALYRALADQSLRLAVRGAQTASSEVQRTAEIKRHAMELVKTAHLEFKRRSDLNPSNRIFLNGVDVTDSIRTPEVSMAASQISAIPEVRAALLGLQRRLGCVGHTILEGRDIGTVVFQDADMKFFLTASAEERAKRRLVELEATGADAPSFEEVKMQIIARDFGDSNRLVAPLKKAVDAIEIDTSEMTLDDVVCRMEAFVRSAFKVRGIRLKR